MSKKGSSGVIIVKIRGKLYYQARDNKGHVRASRSVKASNLSLPMARELYKLNKTFDPEVRKKYKVLSHVEEITTESRGKFPTRPGNIMISKKNQFPMLMAVVYGKLGGRGIGCNSGFVRSLSRDDLKLAMGLAERHFYELVARLEGEGHQYDEAEGRDIVARHGIQVNYAWVKYNRIAQRSSRRPGRR